MLHQDGLPASRSTQQDQRFPPMNIQVNPMQDLLRAKTLSEFANLHENISLHPLSIICPKTICTLVINSFYP